MRLASGVLRLGVFSEVGGDPACLAPPRRCAEPWCVGGEAAAGAACAQNRAPVAADDRSGDGVRLGGHIPSCKSGEVYDIYRIKMCKLSHLIAHFVSHETGVMPLYSQDGGGGATVRREPERSFHSPTKVPRYRGHTRQTRAHRGRRSGDIAARP